MDDLEAFLHELDEITDVTLDNTDKLNKSNTKQDWEGFDEKTQEDFLAWLDDEETTEPKKQVNNVVKNDKPIKEDVEPIPLVLDFDAVGFEEIKEDDTSEGGLRINLPVSPGPSTLSSTSKIQVSSGSLKQMDKMTESLLLSALSGELQQNSSDPHNVIELCHKLGGIPESMRGDVWMTLLGVSENSTTSNSFNERKVQSWDDEVTEEDKLRVMADSACIRLERYSITNEKEYHSDALKPSYMLVRTLFRECCKRKVTLPSTCDPGLADVLCVLSLPCLKLNPGCIPIMVDSLLHLNVLSLDFGHSFDCQLFYGKRIGELFNQVLNDLVKLHDPELGRQISALGDGNALNSTSIVAGDVDIGLPWRWWRCAFAGEMPPNTILKLWDHIIMDACPSRTGYNGPIQLNDSNGGTPDGCDPRGPLVFYLVVALLISIREELLDLTKNGSPNVAQVILDVVRSTTKTLSTAKLDKLCKEARILRNSTPLSTVELLIQSSTNNNKMQAQIESILKKPLPTPKRSGSLFSTGWFSRTLSNDVISDAQSVSSRSVASNDSRESTSFSERLRRSFGLQGNSSKSFENNEDAAETESEDSASQNLDMVDDIIALDPQEEQRRQRVNKENNKLKQLIVLARQQLNGIAAGTEIEWNNWWNKGVFMADHLLIKAAIHCYSISSSGNALHWRECFVLIIFNRVFVLQPLNHVSTWENVQIELKGSKLTLLHNIHGSQITKVKIRDAERIDHTCANIQFLDYSGMVHGGANGEIEMPQAMCELRIEENELGRFQEAIQLCRNCLQ